MKKMLLAALALPLSISLTGCANTSTPLENAYRVELTTLGYSGKDNVYTVPEVNVKLTAMRGAPDVNELTYTATLFDSNNVPATADDSYLVRPSGTLMTGAKGGYQCTGTVEALCTFSSADAVMATNGNWGNNRVVHAIVPIEWAVAHSARGTGETAAWYVKMDYTAYMSNGNKVSWSQNYQFVSPAE